MPFALPLYTTSMLPLHVYIIIMYPGIIQRLALVSAGHERVSSYWTFNTIRRSVFIKHHDTQLRNILYILDYIYYICIPAPMFLPALASRQFSRVRLTDWILVLG